MDFLVYYIIIVLSIIMGMSFQMYPYLKHRYPGSNDIIYHIQRTRKPEDGFGIVGYPNLFHYLTAAISGKLTRLNERQILKYGNLLALIPTLVFAYLSLMIFDIHIVAFAFPLIMASPILTYHSHTFSPRLLGIWFYNLSVLLYLFPYPFSFISSVLVALVALTHRMSMQTLFFTSIILGFINPIIWIEFIIGVVLAIMVSKGYYITILKSHLQFIKMYYRKPHLPNNELKGLIISPSNLSVFIIIFIYLINLLNYGISFSLSSSMQYLFMWSVVPISLVILWRMGLSFQHAAFSVAPSSLLFIYLTDQLPVLNILYWLVLIQSIGLSIMYVRKVEYLDPKLEQLLRSLSNIDGVVLCAPNTLKRKAPYFSGAYTYHYDDIHFDKEQLLKLFREHHITHLLIRKKFAQSLEGFKKVKESGDWVIFEYIK